MNDNQDQPDIDIPTYLPYEQAPRTLTSDNINIDQTNDSSKIEILFKVPQEHIQNIQLKFEPDTSIEQIKKEIEAQHPMKPKALKQKIFYAGKLRDNKELLREVLGSKVTNVEPHIFHLQIYTKVNYPSNMNSSNFSSANLKSDNLGSENEGQQQPQQQQIPQQAPRRAITKEEIFLTDKYMKYERELIKEYRKTIIDLNERKLINTDSDAFGHYQQQGLDTNLSAKSHLLLSTLPLMERGFQERLHFYTTANNISSNVGGEFNENIAIRFLGYDSIIQFTFLIKLCMFMLIFGMNAPGMYRWIIIVFLVCYYFHHVRTIYVEHYDRQRRMLNLEQNNGEQNQDDILIMNNLLGGILRTQHDPEHQERLQQRSKIYRFFRTMFILVFHFFLCLHPDWIERRLRLYDRARLVEQQLLQQQQEQQARDEALQQQNEQDQLNDLNNQPAAANTDQIDTDQQQQSVAQQKQKSVNSMMNLDQFINPDVNTQNLHTHLISQNIQSNDLQQEQASVNVDSETKVKTD
eukprot:403337620